MDPITAMIMGFLISISISVLVMFLYDPQVPEHKNIALQEFEYPSVDRTKAVNEIFGTVKVKNAQVIEWDNPIMWKIRKSYTTGMLMWKKKKKVDIGFFYTNYFTLAVGTKVDVWKAFYRDDKLITNMMKTSICREIQDITELEDDETLVYKHNIDYIRPAPNQQCKVDTPDLLACKSVDRITVMTGSKNIINASPAGKSLILFSFGDGKEPSPEFNQYHHPQVMAGYYKYKSVACAKFPNAFLGDNKLRMPRYAFKVGRYDINGWEYENNDNGDVNPASILYYILTQMLNIPESSIDLQSFKCANKTLFDEGNMVSFLMEKPGEIGKWIKELTRYIDGTIFLDPIAGKFKLRLFRSDEQEVVNITDEHVKDFIFEKQGWDKCFNSVTIQYVDPNTDKKITITKENPTVFRKTGMYTTKTLDFMMCRSHEFAKVLLNRTLKKYSYPQATVRFKVPTNIVLFPTSLIKINIDKLGIHDFYARVTNLGGDNEDTNYYEVEAIQDLSFMDDFNVTGIEQPVSEEPSYEINGEIVYDYVEMCREFTENNIEVSYMLLFNMTEENLSNLLFLDEETNDKYNMNPYGEIISYHKNIKNELSITIQNPIGFNNIMVDDEKAQTQNAMLVINKNLFYFHGITNNEDGTITFTKVKPLINLKNYEININDKCWYVNQNNINYREFEDSPSAKMLNITPTNGENQRDTTTIQIDDCTYKARIPYTPDHIDFSYDDEKIYISYKHRASVVEGVNAGYYDYRMVDINHTYDNSNLSQYIYNFHNGAVNKYTENDHIELFRQDGVNEVTMWVTQDNNRHSSEVLTFQIET